MAFRGQPETVREYGLSGTEPVINQECMLVHEKSGRFVNLSGTAIIRFLLPSQATDSLWRIFLYIKRICYMAPPVMQENLLMAGGDHSS